MLKEGWWILVLAPPAVLPPGGACEATGFPFIMPAGFPFFRAGLMQPVAVAGFLVNGTPALFLFLRMPFLRAFMAFMLFITFPILPLSQ